MSDGYAEFLAKKRRTIQASGFEAEIDHPGLFDFQRAVVAWALRRGRAAIFADTGLGKTRMQVCWADRVAAHAQGRVLILAPLAVTKQTEREAALIGIGAKALREDDGETRIAIANYEMLEHFEADDFVGVVLDESSILKSMDGKTRIRLTEAFAQTHYKLACTATPAPNDFTELGQHAQFLGIMTHAEMLSMFFVHDGGSTQDWRIKGHAVEPFWSWVCEWACVVRHPRDLGFPGERYDLPPLRIIQHVVGTTARPKGWLFHGAKGLDLQERRGLRRDSIGERVAAIVKLVTRNGDARTEEALSQEMASGEQGTRARLQGSAQAPEERQATPVICDQCITESKSQGVVDSVAETEPTCQEGSTPAPSILNNPGRIRRNSTGTGRRMRNLRSPRHEQTEYISPRGSLPQEGQATGDTVYGLQSGDRQVQGRSVAPMPSSGIPEEQWIIWCGLNQEQEALSEALGTLAISVHGSLDPEEKERRLLAWLDGRHRILISKSSICGHGLNLQSCHRMVFCGMNDSAEQFYQAVRRCWRFGQTQPVEVHIVISEPELAVLDNVEAKQQRMQEMGDQVVRLTRAKVIAAINPTAHNITEDRYMRDVAKGKGWTLHLGDSCEVIKEIADDSIGYSVFSPPFNSLYTYSASPRDMGNCADDDDFSEHFAFLIRELYRVIKPGRLCSVHCMNLPTSKARDGFIGITDFRGNIIRAFQEAGWIYHSEVCIWKDPVTAMQRTKALGLLWKQLKKDSTMSRNGIPDYVVTFRKPGTNAEPVEHTDKEFPVAEWQQYASPIWTDINPSETLQKESAREHEDERHIAPLQLEVIRRCLRLWSRDGDLVLSPFAGIGSELYEAVKAGRQAVGIELKLSYWQQAVANLKRAEIEAKQRTLFS